jgi:hypothetical protein
VAAVGGGLAAAAAVALCVACRCRALRACPCCARMHHGTAGTDRYGQVIVNEDDDLAYGLETV